MNKRRRWKAKARRRLVARTMAILDVGEWDAKAFLREHAATRRRLRGGFRRRLSRAVDGFVVNIKSEFQIGPPPGVRDVEWARRAGRVEHIGRRA